MCLMHTDLPVPEGPRIIEIRSSGRPMFRPRRIRLRPNALWTSMNSMASSLPEARRLLSSSWYWYSSSSESPSLTTESRERSRPGSSSRCSPPAARCSANGSPPPSAHDSVSWRSVGASDRSPSPQAEAGLGAAGRSPPSSPSLRPNPKRLTSTSDGCSRVRAPEELRPEHADDVHEYEVQDHRLRRGGPDADRPAAGVVPVIAADQYHGGGHEHGLDEAV